MIWCSTLVAADEPGYIVLGIILPLLVYIPMVLMTWKIAENFLLFKEDNAEGDEDMRRLL